jgi:hypothetical protein
MKKKSICLVLCLAILIGFGFISEGSSGKKNEVSKEEIAKAKNALQIIEKAMGGSKKYSDSYKNVFSIYRKALNQPSDLPSLIRENGCFAKIMGNKLVAVNTTKSYDYFARKECRIRPYTKKEKN